MLAAAISPSPAALAALALANAPAKSGCKKGYRLMKRNLLYLKSFGRRVKILREDLDLSQPELAANVQRNRGLSFTQSYLSKLESGNKVPGGEIVLALAQELGTTCDFLLGRTDDPSLPTEREAVAFAPEAEEAAKIIDGLSPDLRKEALAKVQSLYEEEALRRTRNAEAWQRMLNTVERVAGKPAREQIEKALIAESMEVVGYRAPN